MRLLCLLNRLAELLNLEAPTLPTAASLSKSSLQIVETGSAFTRGEDLVASGGIYDDEEERKFYEDVLDLAEDVPGTLLGLSNKEKVEEMAPPEPLAEIQLEDIPEDDLAPTSNEEEPIVESVLEGTSRKEDMEPEEAIQSGPAARLAAIFAALPEANNRTMVDKLAVDFAFLNSKAARKKCIRVRGLLKVQWYSSYWLRQLWLLRE